MKIYKCDICKAEIDEKSAIGIAKYANAGWTIRRMAMAIREAENEKHACSDSCLCKFLVSWIRETKAK